MVRIRPVNVFQFPLLMERVCPGRFLTVHLFLSLDPQVEILNNTVEKPPDV